MLSKSYYLSKRRTGVMHTTLMALVPLVFETSFDAIVVCDFNRSHENHGWQSVSCCV